jgi:alpha-tubulin suppressor-like RCC1 family protein
VVAVSAGLHHTMAIKTDGSLWAWGSNGFGQLGIGNGMDSRGTVSLTPIKIMEDVLAVSSGQTHTMAIKSDGTLWGWGFHSHGQIGDGATITVVKNGLIPEDNYRFTPVKIMDNVVAVSAGARHTMAIKTDGSLWAWGSGESGQLGDGTWNNRRFSPVKIMENVGAVSTGDGHTLAIRTDGSLWGWGSNYFSCLGDGTWESHNSPKRITEDVVRLDNPPVIFDPQETIEVVNLDVPPQIIGDRTLLPIRAVCEALGASVNWDGNTQTVIITCSQELIDDKNRDVTFFEDMYRGEWNSYINLFVIAAR